MCMCFRKKRFSQTDQISDPIELYKILLFFATLQALYFHKVQIWQRSAYSPVCNSGLAAERRPIFIYYTHPCSSHRNALPLLWRPPHCFDHSANKYYYWRCHCDCGNEIVVQGTVLRRGDTKSCGCLQAEESARRTKDRLMDLTGKRFGLLTVLERVELDESGYGLGKWKCQCDCGNIKLKPCIHPDVRFFLIIPTRRVGPSQSVWSANYIFGADRFGQRLFFTLFTHKKAIKPRLVEFLRIGITRVYWT